MNEKLQDSVQNSLNYKEICLAEIVPHFDASFLEETNKLFEKIKEMDFSGLEESKQSIILAQINAFNSAIKSFIELPTSSSRQERFKISKESLLVALNELESQPENARLSIKNILSEKALNYNQIEQTIIALSARMEEETQTITDNFKDYQTGLKNLEKKFEDLAPIETLTTEATTTLTLAKEALDKAQKTKTIEFSDTLSKEYSKLQTKYFVTGLGWQALAIASFIGIFCVLHYHNFCPLVPSNEMKDIFHDGFVNSIYALSPIFSKIGLIAFFATVSGICLKIYFQYKRLSQEYRQKSLLAKNLLTGHDVLKPYIGDKIDTAFILPTIEKMLEDPLSKVYSKQESHENTLGLAEKVLELTKKGKELGSAAKD
ncbi:hypothetical protein [Sulfurospirillum multivorans]|uniref:Uncharacterized protein n=2 Tax=Sulfurospirillum multivorans TaxID=66821 RepID=A0AA86AMG5_SULMK|nr:hypothetical protein [Sulfurospirillum multivorans]AHJ12307.1 hypothetical protein SMUL_1041 [Sulfurospirillum multivorans DSM 12446]QEH05807.1 hypothetical protein SMN_1033 [Sulfurospirillum multivorans]